MNVRSVLVALGVGLAVVGAAVLLRPSLAAGVSVHEVLLVVLGGGVALIGAIRLKRAMGVPRRVAETAEPERIAPIPVPGEAVDRHWDEYRLESVATIVVMRARGCDEVTAKRQLARGTWTEDPVAARYFATDPPDADGGLLGRLRSLALGGRRRSVERARVVEELWRLTDLARREGPG